MQQTIEKQVENLSLKGDDKDNKDNKDNKFGHSRNQPWLFSAGFRIPETYWNLLSKDAYEKDVEALTNSWDLEDCIPPPVASSKGIMRSRESNPVSGTMEEEAEALKAATKAHVEYMKDLKKREDRLKKLKTSVDELNAKGKFHVEKAKEQESNLRYIAGAPLMKQRLIFEDLDGIPPVEIRLYGQADVQVFLEAQPLLQLLGFSTTTEQDQALRGFDWLYCINSEADVPAFTIGGFESFLKYYEKSGKDQIAEKVRDWFSKNKFLVDKTDQGFHDIMMSEIRAMHRVSNQMESSLQNVRQQTETLEEMASTYGAIS